MVCDSLEMISETLVWKPRSQNELIREPSNPKEISDTFDSIGWYFSTVGQNLNNNFDRNSDFKKLTKYNSLHSFYLEPIVIQEVIKEISNLKCNKSLSPDDISPIIIKTAATHIAPILTKIFNMSIDQEVYPDLLKISKVISLFEKGCKLLPENYRPISLLDIFEKIYERLLYKIVFFSTNMICYWFPRGSFHHTGTNSNNW